MKDTLETQKRILAEISVRGSASVQELSKRLKLRPHIVRYNLSALLQRGGLKKLVLIEQRSLGLQTVSFLFNLPPQTQKEALQFLEKSPNVFWLAQNGGAREFEMVWTVRHPGEMLSQLQELSESTGSHLADRLTAFEEDSYSWGVRVLAEAPEKVNPIITRRRETYLADELDLKILRATRTVSDMSIREIAQSVGATTSTVQYRLEKLRGKGIISDEMYFMVHELEGLVQMNLFITFKGRTRQDHNKVIDFCQNDCRVSELVTCVGDWDYKIVAYERGLEQLLTFERTLKRVFAARLSSCIMCLQRRVLSLKAGV